MANMTPDPDKIVGEVKFAGFHVVACNISGMYATHTGRQDIRLYVTNEDGSGYTSDVSLPSPGSVDNFLKRLAGTFDFTGQAHTEDALTTLQSFPVLQQKIDGIAGATWKDWKRSRDLAKRGDGKSFDTSL